MSCSSKSKILFLRGKKYADIKSTPLEIEIHGKVNSQTVDVGKAVHDFIGMSP
ncbi:MAG: hypothetical protein LBT05_03920 [Planctomycetaceae bacterium]|jgi:hypothetical protein|nr:hypothetical protein [Planctomycetaceae bacterium]